MLEFLLDPIALFLGVVILCCAYCAASLCPLVDFVKRPASIPHGHPHTGT